MPAKYTVKVRKVGKSMVVTVPKPVIEGMGLREGDKVDLIVDKDIRIKPLK